eukprot:9445719-Pyramimonas_sp.AAC.1
MCTALGRGPHFEQVPPSIRQALALRRICAALRREPHVESASSPFRETAPQMSGLSKGHQW